MSHSQKHTVVRSEQLARAVKRDHRPRNAWPQLDGFRRGGRTARWRPTRTAAASTQGQHRVTLCDASSKGQRAKLSAVCTALVPGSNSSEAMALSLIECDWVCLVEAYHLEMAHVTPIMST